MKLKSRTLIGTVAGDIIGSKYEGGRVKSMDFELFPKGSRFTDDTILTMAIAKSILDGEDYVVNIKDFARRYPHRGYGGYFKRWVYGEDTRPYNSYGNGAAMRVSPVGFAFNDLDTVLQRAKETAEVTHNHPEGIKGAQAVAAAIFLARNGKDKSYIRDFIEQNIGYDLSFSLDEIRSEYKFSATAPDTVPQAIVAFLESMDFENAIRLAISIGGDTDTIAAMTGGIAIAFYKDIPSAIVEKVEAFLPEEFIQIMNRFDERFGY